MNTSQIFQSSETCVAKATSFETSRKKTALIVFVAVALFTILPLYKSLRQPRIGDTDNMNIGLMILNRYSRDAFPRDAAMQAGEWWAGYTPIYLIVLGTGYRLVNDLGIVFAFLTGFAYLALMTGFYCLGRRLKLSILLSLALAYMSGLYIVTAGGLAWTGAGNEMATPRNIYLGLLPWILLQALYLYQQPVHRARRWLFFGALLGLSTFIHPITGGFIIGVLTVMMVIGCLTGSFRWRDLIIFGLAVMPATLIGYKVTSPLFQFDTNISIGNSFIYSSIARANIFFFRISGWAIPIILWTVSISISGLLLLRSKWLNRSLPTRVWVWFGLTLFGGLLLILLVDWWVLWIAVEWARRKLSKRESFYENVTLVYLLAVLFCTFTISSTLSLLYMATSFTPIAAMARLFQRGGTLSHAALIVLSAFYLWEHLRNYPSRFGFLVTALATMIVGLHQAEFERIPGDFLPFDYWIYLGVLLLILWPKLQDGILNYIRNFGVAMLLFEAATRLLAISVEPVVTLLIGLDVLLVCLALNKLPPAYQKRPILITIAAVAILGIVLVPFDGKSTFQKGLSDTQKAIFRDWSRVDMQSYYSPFYAVGSWLRENTPPDSLIYTDITELRYWSFRSQTVGKADYVFLQNGSHETYNLLLAEGKRIQSSFYSIDDLMKHSRELGADYIVMSKSPTSIVLSPPFAMNVFETGNYVVYRVIK